MAWQLYDTAIMGKQSQALLPEWKLYLSRQAVNRIRL
jgi:hypothetical protein